MALQAITYAEVALAVIAVGFFLLKSFGSPKVKRVIRQISAHIHV